MAEEKEMVGGRAGLAGRWNAENGNAAQKKVGLSLVLAFGGGGV